MKLVNFGHAQSEETRVKIGVGVRMGWERRRGKLMLQETCHFEWMSLIGEASRKGYCGEEELQWDSYKILDEQLTKEWPGSVEQRKSMPRPKGCKRAPNSLEQRRKIAEAIGAKWADPEYRKRVCSGLAKFHGIPSGAERKPKRKPTAGTQSKQSPLKRKASDIIDSSATQRAAEETKKTEAVERVRLLIAEAEEVAKALEVAAIKSPVARAALIETRKLIAEAIRSIESIEIGQIASNENIGYVSVDSFEPVSQVRNKMQLGNIRSNQAEPKEVNGNQSLSFSKHEEFDLPRFIFPKAVNGDSDVQRASLNNHSSSTLASKLRSSRIHLSNTTRWKQTGPSNTRRVLR
ncbi:Muscle M-line assembly protein unc-89, putative isoform 2 [Hibiscus syriacus]|uniref:Muscle M-line assembly protein unc-89, putative isoform 2 n=1 Tax=Hibiscus syriacus TaxID=106335 RepID=A0A6A2XXW2_HIBSY|nr:Muscle M-line assembly protein unc-89, putative isoform 2 [Hibiscus syriacus]